MKVHRKAWDKAGPNIELATAVCNAWNAKHPVGTPVRFWKILPFGPIVDTATASLAQVLGSVDCVIWIKEAMGISCASLHCVVAACDLAAEAEPPYQQ